MIVVHTTYHLDQEAFIVPTHNETPPPQHSNTRTVCAPSQYIVNIGSPWRHRHIQSTNRVGFASSQVALVIRAKCPCSGHAPPTLNGCCPHNAIATQYTIHIVCRTRKSFTDSTGLDWTGLDWTGLDWTGLDRSMMEVCFDILFIVHSSCSFADVGLVFFTYGCVVLPFSKPRSETRLDGGVSCCLQTNG